MTLSSPQESLLHQTYLRLRALAQSRLSRERTGHTLQATALVHEAWMRLNANRNTPVDQAAFVTAMSEIMRRVLVDHARRKMASRRGKNQVHEELTEALLVPAPESTAEILAVDEALKQLEGTNPRAASLVRLRYFSGLTIEEAAATLFISVPTANRDWAAARAFLSTAIRASS